MSEQMIGEPNIWRIETPGAEGWQRSARPEAGRKYFMVSADCHANEPADLWARRIEPEYRNCIPRVETDEDGVQWRITEGYRPDRIRIQSFEGEDKLRAAAGADIPQRSRDLAAVGVAVGESASPAAIGDGAYLDEGCIRPISPIGEYWSHGDARAADGEGARDQTRDVPEPRNAKRRPVGGPGGAKQRSHVGGRLMRPRVRRADRRWRRPAPWSRPSAPERRPGRRSWRRHPRCCVDRCRCRAANARPDG